MHDEPIPNLDSELAERKTSAERLSARVQQRAI